jgi:hypothetical protein
VISRAWSIADRPRGALLGAVRSSSCTWVSMFAIMEFLVRVCQVLFLGFVLPDGSPDGSLDGFGCVLLVRFHSLLGVVGRPAFVAD